MNNPKISLLVNAAWFGHLGAVRHLVEAGHDINDLATVWIHEGWGPSVTPLMASSIRGHTAIARFLLESGAYPDLCGSGGETALFWAAQFGYAETVQALLDGGANHTFCAIDSAGAFRRSAIGSSLRLISPQQIARKNRHFDVVAILETLPPFDVPLYAIGVEREVPSTTELNIWINFSGNGATPEERQGQTLLVDEIADRNVGRLGGVSNGSDSLSFSLYVEDVEVAQNALIPLIANFLPFCRFRIIPAGKDFQEVEEQEASDFSPRDARPSP